MWNKGKPSNSRKSYSYYQRLKVFREELRTFGKTTHEFMNFLTALDARCKNIIEKEEQRIEEENEVK